MKKKLNLVDAVLILLIVAAVAACFLFLRQRGTITTQDNTTPMRFTVELRKVYPETIERLEIGQNVYRSTDGTYLGTLADFSYEPYTETEYSQLLERYVTYEWDGRYYLYLVIEGPGYETERDVVINGLTQKIGDEIYVKGKGYAGAGYVVGVDTMASAGVENTAVGLGDTVVTYSVRVSGVRDFTAQALHVGNRVYDTTTGSLLGVVQDVDVQPEYVYEMDAEGNGIEVEREGRRCVFLTLEGRCTETENSYFLDGKCELKVGSELTVSTKTTKCEVFYHALLDTKSAE